MSRVFSDTEAMFSHINGGDGDVVPLSEMLEKADRGEVRECAECNNAEQYDDPYRTFHCVAPCPQCDPLPALSAHAIQQSVEPMFFDSTGGCIWTLFTGKEDPDGYYEFAIGPFDVDGIAFDGSVWVGHDGQSDEVECFTLEQVREAIARFREFDAEAVLLAAHVEG